MQTAWGFATVVSEFGGLATAILTVISGLLGPILGRKGMGFWFVLMLIFLVLWVVCGHNAHYWPGWVPSQISSPHHYNN